MRPCSSQLLRPDALPLHVLRWPGDGTPLLLLHGWMDAAGSFGPLVDGLTMPCVAPDHRGHGRSGHVGPSDDYHFVDYVRDAVDVLDALTEGPVDVLGHSMGGSVATLLAGAFPERVRRLVLLEGLGPPFDDPADGPSRLARWIRELRQLAPPSPSDDEAAALRRLARLHPSVPESRLRRVLPHLVDEAGRWRADPRHRVRTARLYDEAQIAAFWGAIRAPTLVVAGGDSSWGLPLCEARLDRIAGARLEVVPGCGHMLHMQAPEAVAGLVGGFLAG